MDFRFTPAQEAFRAEVRAFLRETLTPTFWDYWRAHRLPGWSPEFSQAAGRRRLLAVAWPQQYGGRGYGPIEQMICTEEMVYAGAPLEHHRRAVQQVGPSIILFGTTEQKQRFLPGIARGLLSFAMGLSEPNAGSDLAGVETTAIRDGDEYIINGRKRFTSGAHYSDYLWTVCRTNPAAPKHRGLSVIVVPLKATGVDVRPLIDLQGRHHFNEVFLHDVRVPVENRIGEEDRGWYINAATMDFERSGIARIATLRRLIDHCVAMFQKEPDGRKTTTRYYHSRTQLADLYCSAEVARLLSYRVAWLQSLGKIPNYEVSMQKILATETIQRVHAFIVNYLGLFGLIADNTDEFDESPGAGYLSSVALTIGQGTSEINRTVIATRGLGLPRG